MRQKTAACCMQHSRQWSWLGQVHARLPAQVHAAQQWKQWQQQLGQQQRLALL
jgi:hypothetical protein